MASGFYIGTSDKYYRSHKVWLKDTRNVRVGDTVFFKNKYLTMPTITPADAMLKAADNLIDTIKENIPMSNLSNEAVKILMKIIKQASPQAKKGTDEAKEPEAEQPRTEVLLQRQQNENSNAQRVKLNEGLEQEENTPIGDQHNLPIISQEDEEEVPNGINKDDNDESKMDSPAYNTRACHRERTLTHECMTAALFLSKGKFNAQTLAQRKIPLKVLTDLSGAVLDGATGEMLEYRNLVKNPKYREEWSFSFGNEIGRLAQGMPGWMKGTDTI